MQDGPSELSESSPQSSASPCPLFTQFLQKQVCTERGPCTDAGKAEMPHLQGPLNSWFGDWHMHSPKHYDLMSTELSGTSDPN